MFNNFYGTTRTPVIDKLNKKTFFLTLIGKGRSNQNKKLDYKLVTFFILPLAKRFCLKDYKRHSNDQLIAEEDKHLKEMCCIGLTTIMWL